MYKRITKILSYMALALITVFPMNEVAMARISAASTVVQSQSVTNSISAGSVIARSRVSKVGGGCSILPGGYCYNTGTNRISAGNTFYGGRLSAYGSNTLNPNLGETVRPSKYINATDKIKFTFGTHIDAGGTTDGTHIDASGEAGEGNRINASGSTQETTGTRIPAGGLGSGTSNVGGRIPAGGTSTGTRIPAGGLGSGTSNVGGRIPAGGEGTVVSQSEGNRINASGTNNGHVNLCNARPYPKDVDGHWSEIFVRRLYDLCIIEGYRDGSFKPNQEVTRAELTKMALFAKGVSTTITCYDECENAFQDLDSWQKPWVNKAFIMGVVEGYQDGSFRPNQSITRSEAVKVVLATFDYRPLNVEKSFFNDVNDWSVSWVERAHELGMIQGIGNGDFAPSVAITRAEAAKIISIMVEHWDTVL